MALKYKINNCRIGEGRGLGRAPSPPSPLNQLVTPSRFDWFTRPTSTLGTRVAGSTAASPLVHTEGHLGPLGGGQLYRRTGHRFAFKRALVAQAAAAMPLVLV